MECVDCVISTSHTHILSIKRTQRGIYVMYSHISTMKRQPESVSMCIWLILHWTMATNAMTFVENCFRRLAFKSRWVQYNSPSAFLPSPLPLHPSPVECIQQINITIILTETSLAADYWIALNVFVCMQPRVVVCYFAKIPPDLMKSATNMPSTGIEHIDVFAESATSRRQLNEPRGYRPTYCAVHFSMFFYCVLDRVSGNMRPAEKRNDTKECSIVCLWRCSFHFVWDYCLSSLYSALPFGNLYESMMRRKYAQKLFRHTLACNARVKIKPTCVHAYNVYIYMIVFRFVSATYQHLAHFFSSSYHCESNFNFSTICPSEFGSLWFDANFDIVKEKSHAKKAEFRISIFAAPLLSLRSWEKKYKFRFCHMPASHQNGTMQAISDTFWVQRNEKICT